MATIDKHQSASTTKMLLIADSGAGKTGALASLAAAGYNIRILDLDNGLDVLRNLLTDPTSKYPKDSASRVRFITLTEKMKLIGGKLVPASATVWNRAMETLSNWKEDDGTVLGPIASWGQQDILVIDSLSLLCNAAMAWVLMMNGRIGQRPHQSDWGAAQDLIEGLLMMLYDEGVKCNVIVNCHIVYIGEDNGPQRAYPASLGKALSPRIGRYFNSALMVKATGQGTALKRLIHTTTAGLVELKNTAPLRVAPTYPLETGLADYFKAVRGG